MSRRPGHACDLSAEDKKQEELELQGNLNLKPADLCGFCEKTKAVRRLKMQDGIMIRLCQQCYEEEMRKRGQKLQAKKS